MTHRIPASKAALYVQLGHTTNEPRGMPIGFTGHAGRADYLLQFPHGTIVESMPWGADMGLPNYGSFGEWITSSFSYEHSELAIGYDAHVREILTAGRRYVLYIGRPQTELDMEVGRYMLSHRLHPRIQIAFDASAPEPEGSCTHRLMQEFPERVFWGEAHPKEAWRSCMAKSRLVYYASERRKVDPITGGRDWSYIHDGNHPEIMIAMTGHGRESFEHDIRDAIRWSRQGHTIAFEPHHWDEFKGSIEIVEGE